MTISNSPAIRTDGLTRDFAAVRAVDGLTLEVPAGIVFGFLGPNGAGKTTTIRLLLGLLEPTAGCAEVLGFDSVRQGQQIRTRAGALLEHAGLYERLSAEHNLEFAGRIWHMPAADRRARIHELLSHFGLWERRAETVGSWSRGMKQKLAVARALFHRPSLVFLDEPTAGLDPVASSALRDDLAGLVAQEGVTVFINTHNLSEAEKLCARVAVIRQGRLMALGHPDELKAQTSARAEISGRNFSDALVASLAARPGIRSAALQNGRLVLAMARDTELAPIVSAIVGAGGLVEEVRRDKASLEEVFLTLMEEGQ